MLRAQAKTARLKLKIAKLNAKEKKRKLKEIAAIEELEQLEDAAGMLKELLSLEPVTRIANLNFLDLELLANLG